MEDTIKIRKDKIKNIAIVFLSVMLILTFFSNSILNRALPQVATAYVEYNTITEKVRGTGIVTANDPYKVVAKDTRTIESVAVAVGDVVEKDQILFYLEDAESEELKGKEEEIEAKEEELSEQVLAYMTSLLNLDISNQAYHNIQNDNISTAPVYQARIEESRQKVESAQNTVDSLNRQILIASMDSDADIDRETQIALATANRDNAASKMAEAESEITKAEQIISALGGSTDSDEEDGGPNSLEVIALEAEAAFNRAVEDYEIKKAELMAVLPFTESDYFKDGYPKGMEKLIALQELAAASGEPAISAFENFKNAYDVYLTAKETKKTANQNLNDYKKAKSILKNAKAALEAATSEYEAYQEKIDSLTREGTQSAGDNEELQNSLKIRLADAEAALADAKKEQEQLLKDISNELALSEQNEDIAKTESDLAKLKKELEEMKEELTDAVVTAPVEGTVINIAKTAGESTVAQEDLADIQVAGKGTSLSFSVTNAQAAKVKVGDKATLQNAWYYNDVMVTLSKIKPDVEDPGKKKLLEFTVEGSVQNGETLSLSIGERSAEYEQVVPNSAIREDNSGKFILIIEEKATPFGNRYKAKRVGVEVLASDEINTAILADLQGYEYVITTSNQPVEAGDQVRLNG